MLSRGLYGNFYGVPGANASQAVYYSFESMTKKKLKESARKIQEEKQEEVREEQHFNMALGVWSIIGSCVGLWLIAVWWEKGYNDHG